MNGIGIVCIKCRKFKKFAGKLIDDRPQGEVLEFCETCIGILVKDLIN